jgi:hypothetical protein
MLSQFRYCLLLAVLIGASLSAVSTAGAATATITGGPSLSSTASTSTLLKLHNAGKTLSCTGSTTNGTVAASTGGSLSPGFRVGTITPSFTGCTIVGGLGITVRCTPAAFNVSSLTTSGTTKGSLSGVSCLVFVTSQTGCRLTVIGSVGVTHANSPSQITTDTNHQTVLAGSSTNGTGGVCSVLPNDRSARFVNAANGDAQYNSSPTNVNINVSSSGLSSPTGDFTYSPGVNSIITFATVGTTHPVTATFHSSPAGLIGHITGFVCTGDFTCDPSVPANTALTDGQSFIITVKRTGSTPGGLSMSPDFGTSPVSWGLTP